MTKFEWTLPRLWKGTLKLPAYVQKFWVEDPDDRPILVMAMIAVSALLAFLSLPIILTKGIALLVPLGLVLIFDLFRFVGHIQLTAGALDE